MSKSYKLKDGNYIDSSGIVHGSNHKLLSDFITNVNSALDNQSTSYGGLVKKTIRDNNTTFTVTTPNARTDNFIRKIIVAVGDKGLAYIGIRTW